MPTNADTPPELVEDKAGQKAALEREAAGYKQRGDSDRLKQVQASIKALGKVETATVEPDETA